MSVEESRKLRNILLSIAINRKFEKIQHKHQQRINDVVKDWNETISNYLKTISKLFELIQMAEQQSRLDQIDSELQSFNKLTSGAAELCNKFFEFFKYIIPDSSLNVFNYLDVITKANSQLEDIKDMLSSILIVSSKREIIESVQEVKLKMEGIQSEMKVIHSQITDCTENILKQTSNNLSTAKEERNESVAEEMDSFEE